MIIGFKWFIGGDRGGVGGGVDIVWGIVIRELGVREMSGGGGGLNLGERGVVKRERFDMRLRFNVVIVEGRGRGGGGKGDFGGWMGWGVDDKLGGGVVGGGGFCW